MIRLIASAVAVALGFVTGTVSHPPHVAPPAAEAPAYEGTVVPDLLGQIVDYIGWIEGVRRGEAEEAARVAAARRPAISPVVSGGTCDLTGWTVPAWVLDRESHCSLDAYNATGCGGRGCVGAAQLDVGHFSDPSPWGGVGSCWGLDPNSISDQQQCVAILSADGTNLSPWGG